MTVLVQGAGGGVATALTVLGSAAGVRVWVTSRSEHKRAEALALGADQAFESGARLPERVDAVMETVGKATWGHSIRSLKPGGTLVVSGATSGDAPPAELTRVFFLQLSVIGSTMGTRDELERLIRFCLERDIRPRDPRHDAAGRRPRRLSGHARRRRRRQDRLHDLAAARQNDDQRAAAQAAGVHRPLRLGGPLRRVLAGHAQLRACPSEASRRSSHSQSVRSSTSRTHTGCTSMPRSVSLPSQPRTTTIPPPSRMARERARVRAARCRSTPSTPSGSISRTAPTKPSPRGDHHVGAEPSHQLLVLGLGVGDHPQAPLARPARSRRRPAARRRR